MSLRKILGSIAIIAIILFAFYLIIQAMSMRDGGAEKSFAQGAMSTPAVSVPVVPAPSAQLSEGEMEQQLKEYQNAVSEDRGLSKLYLVKCAACHGRDGTGPIGPSIAGKSKDENFTILMKYKNDEVKNTMMRGLLDKTDIAELEMLAEEISAF